MKAGVILFPGSNCAEDAYYAWDEILQQDVSYIWHKDSDLNSFDLIVVPGGFSYGDYLRAGAIASLSPAVKALREFAGGGGLVLGICNGFQILTEAGLLPGVLLRNRSLRFISKPQYVKVESVKTPFTYGYSKGDILNFPIAHNEGNYFVDEETLKSLIEEDRIVFRYASADGKTDDSANPNGSLENIAGIVNEKRNVLGMMPHPERAMERLLGSDDGKILFQSIMQTLERV
jgi:phosphoribosylformylglycinamidine synthase